MSYIAKFYQIIWKVYVCSCSSLTASEQMKEKNHYYLYFLLSELNAIDSRYKGDFTG